MASNFSDEDFLGSFNLAMPDENEYFEKLDKRRLDIDVIKMRGIVSTQETPESKVLTEIKSLKVSRDDVASRKKLFFNNYGGNLSILCGHDYSKQKTVFPIYALLPVKTNANIVSFCGS